MSRIVELQINDNWVDVGGINNLKKGDNFRMFEIDGEVVVGEGGKVIFHATSEPYWSDIYESWMIDVGDLLH